MVELSGTAEHSFEDAAATLGKVLGAPVKSVRVPEPGIVGALTAAGVPPAYAELYREMAIGIEAGRVAFEGGTRRQVRGATTLEQAVRRLVG